MTKNDFDQYRRFKPKVLQTVTLNPYLRCLDIARLVGIHESATRLLLLELRDDGAVDCGEHLTEMQGKWFVR